MSHIRDANNFTVLSFASNICEKLLGETCDSFDQIIRNWHAGEKKLLS